MRRLLEIDTHEHPDYGGTGFIGSRLARRLLYESAERISVLDQLTKSSTNASQLRIKRVKPDAYATVVSVSGPMHFPGSSDGSRSPLVVVVIGVLAVGALLAAGGLVLGRRSRRPR